MNNRDDEFYLMTPKAELSMFIRQCDREYFSRPVRIERLYSAISTRLLYVRDPARGEVYPVNPKHIVPWFRLPAKHLARTHP